MLSEIVKGFDRVKFHGFIPPQDGSLAMVVAVTAVGKARIDAGRRPVADLQERAGCGGRCCVGNLKLS